MQSPYPHRQRHVYTGEANVDIEITGNETLEELEAMTAMYADAEVVDELPEQNEQADKELAQKTDTDGGTSDADTDAGSAPRMTPPKDLRKKRQRPRVSQPKTASTLFLMASSNESAKKKPNSKSRLKPCKKKKRLGRNPNAFCRCVISSLSDWVLLLKTYLKI